MAWPLIGVLVAAALAAGAVGSLLRRRGKGDSRMRSQRLAAQAAELAMVLDSVPLTGNPTSMTMWWQVVDEEQTKLAAALSEAVAASRKDCSEGAVREIRVAADAARRAVAADRALRTARETPTRDQLAYSLAQLRESSARLKRRAATLEHTSATS